MCYITIRLIITTGKKAHRTTKSLKRQRYLQWLSIPRRLSELQLFCAVQDFELLLTTRTFLRPFFRDTLGQFPMYKNMTQTLRCLKPP